LNGEASNLYEQVTLIILSVSGAILAALLGWGEPGEPFDPRKFACSDGRAIIAGLLAALAFQDVAAVTIWTCVLALLTGAGLDVIGHRSSGVWRRLREG